MKKSLTKPSTPGLLPLFIESVALEISSADIFLSSSTTLIGLFAKSVSSNVLSIWGVFDISLKWSTNLSIVDSSYLELAYLE